MVVLTGFVSLYYNVIIAWSLYYFGMSFFPTLPWTTCHNDWNTPACAVRETQLNMNTTHRNTSYFNEPSTTASVLTTTVLSNSSAVDAIRPTQEFWE